MRIISGKYRGRRLKELKFSGTRPTLDRVKESLFNILQGRLEDAAVLDLFAGTGSLGFEAMSRGAKKVIFNDNDREAVALIKENLRMLTEPKPPVLTVAGFGGWMEDRKEYNEKKNSENAHRVLGYNFTDALRALKSEKFDVIFLDPPYGKDLGGQAIQKIEEYGLLAPGGVIVLEENSKKELKLPLKKYIIKDTRIYGSAALYFFGEEE